MLRNIGLLAMALMVTPLVSLGQDIYCAEGSVASPSQQFKFSSGARASQSLTDGGQLHALIIFVRFKDDDYDHCAPKWVQWTSTDTSPDFADNFLAPAESDGSAPDGPFADSSLTGYFYSQSDSSFVLYGEAYEEVYVTEFNESEYEITNSTSTTRGGMQDLTKEVLDYLDGEGFDFTKYDNDGPDGIPNSIDDDGQIDHIFFVVRRISVSTNWNGWSVLGDTDLTYDGKTLDDELSGSYNQYHKAGNIIPLLNMGKLMAHEIGHDLWPSTVLGGTHIVAISDNDVPAGVPLPDLDPTDYIGYTLMASGGSSEDMAGNKGLSAFERELVEWATCSVLTSSQVDRHVDDLTITGECYKFSLSGGSNGKTVYVSNHQRESYFDELFDFHEESCSSFMAQDGLMETGIVVGMSEGSGGTTKYDELPADNTLDVSNSDSTYDGDLYGDKMQITPWTRPNINGYTFYPVSFAPSWEAVDNIRYETGSSGNMIFDFVQDFRTQPVIREDSWFGEETDEESFNADIVVESGATLTMEDGIDIYLATGREIIVNGTFVVNDASISGDAKWSGITVNSGGRLVLNSGAEINMTEYQSIYVYGELDINGSAVNPVTISGSDWNWIYLSGSGADNARIDYATIDGSRKGIYAVNMDNLSITNTTITDALQQGLWAESLTDPVVFGSSFNGGPSNGIRVKNGGLNLIYSESRNNTKWGMRLENSSAVYFGEESDPGVNIITGNGDHGIFATSSSGTIGLRVEGMGGYSSIHSNGGKDIYLLSGSDVVAEDNWWGESPPNASDFHVSSTSTFDYDPWLTSDPTSAALFSTEEIRGRQIQREYVVTIAMPEEDIITTEFTSAGQFVRKLQEAREQTSRGALTPALETLVDNRSPNFEIATLFLLNDLAYLGNHQEVIARGEQALSSEDYLDVNEAEIAAILFRSYLAEGNVSDAVRMRDRAELIDVETVDVEAMEILLEDYKGTLLPEAPAPVESPEVSADHLSHKVSVYPNPFNPQTTFSISLPRTSTLVITIHDLLGREVGRIEDNDLAPGDQSYTWSANHLGSGMYVYRITADTFRKTGTLVVVK